MASLEEFLATDSSPNDEEEDSLKQFVSDCDDKLKIINMKISELEAQLRILNDEKAAVLKSVAPFRRALSPFRRLPEDIVREIFVACLETRRNPTMANTEAPVLLTQISHTARNIALTTPALWAAIHIPITASFPPEFMDEAKSNMATRAKGVEEWLLRRSGNLPLYISVFQNDHYAEKPDYLADDIMDVIRACCSRWKILFLSCPATSLSRISSVAQADAPLLHSLTIHSNHSRAQYSQFWKSSEIVTIPTLKRFSQLGRASILDHPVNWANLTHLRCHEEYSRKDSFENGPKLSIVGVLRRATCLVSLHINPAYEQGPGYMKIDDISLPHLTSLAINEYRLISIFGPYYPPEPNDVSLLESIYAPALEAISYNIDLKDNARSNALITLLKRSPNVQELSMGTPKFFETIEQYLRHCPSLRGLYIRGSFDSNIKDASTDAQHALLRSFVLDDPTRCLCPKLEYIRCEPTLTISLNVLLDLIMLKKGTNRHLSRWKAVVLNVQHCSADKALIDELKLEEVRGDIKLKISYATHDDFIQSLDEGITRSWDPVNDWCPSMISMIDHAPECF